MKSVSYAKLFYNQFELRETGSVKLKISPLSRIRPYDSLATCGDFSDIVYSQDHVHFIVGDISGHGLALVKKCADEVIAEFKRIVQSPLEEQYQQISQLSNIAKYGMNLCLGKFDRIQGSLSYLCIGHMHFELLRNNNLQALRVNQGIVGILVDKPIRETKLRLLVGDRLMICSDGIDRKATLQALLQANLSANDCIEKIFQYSPAGNDDAICVCFDLLADESNSK